MVLNKCRLYQLEDILETIHNEAEEFEDIDIADDIIETDENIRLVIDGIIIYIPSLKLHLREGVVCVWDCEEEMYVPDFSVTVLYEDKLDKWIYYEQDGMVETMVNWLEGSMRVDEVEQLMCEIIYER